MKGELDSEPTIRFHRAHELPVVHPLKNGLELLCTTELAVERDEWGGRTCCS